MSHDDSHYETESLVEEHDITEVPPPRSKLDYPHLILSYLKGLTPYCISWIPKYNRQKIRGNKNRSQIY